MASSELSNQRGARCTRLHCTMAPERSPTRELTRDITLQSVSTVLRRVLPCCLPILPIPPSPALSRALPGIRNRTLSILYTPTQQHMQPPPPSHIPTSSPTPLDCTPSVWEEVLPLRLLSAVALPGHRKVLAHKTFWYPGPGLLALPSPAVRSQSHLGGQDSTW